MIDVPILVKDALRDGTLKKNYRFNVLNNDGTVDFTIDNDTLVKESVSIDERMCSGDSIKFGLCEGSSLEFQYFNHPNITNRRIQAFIDVQYERDGTILEHEIPMGFFDVKESSRQASTGIIKVVAYNKLMSDYLDAKANSLIVEAASQGEWGAPTNTISLRAILDKTLADYSVEVSPSIKQKISVNTSVRSYNQLDYHRVTADGQHYYLHVYSIGYFITIPGGFKSDSYYRISFNPKAIDDYFEEKRAAFIRDENNNLYTFYEGFLPHDHADGTYYELETAPLAEDIVVTNTKGEFIKVSFLTSRNIENYDTGWITGLSGTQAIDLSFPVVYIENVFSNTPTVDYVKTQMDEAFNDFLPYLEEHMTIVERDLSTIERKTFTLSDVQAWADTTLRDLQSAVFETQCQFGQLDRTTDLFSGHELNGARLLPQETLYPDNSLYPYGGNLSAFKSMYSKLWADEGNIQSWRYLIITYKGLDENGNEKEYTLQRTVNEHGTQNYNCSDNWLFKNLVWTSEQIGQYADAMVQKMRDMRWFPFEMWCAGLPYVETGDEIEIAVGENTYTTYVLQRQLKGIQNLQDTYINGTLDIF